MNEQRKQVASDSRHAVDSSGAAGVTGLANVQNLYGAGASSGTRGRTDYAELGRQLAALDGLVVAVMHDERFAAHQMPADLTFEQLVRVWGTRPNVSVVALDYDQIRSHAVIFKGNVDVLVYPYAGIYPMEAYELYSGQSFNYFLRRGGAVLTTGGVPFSKQADISGKHLPIDTPKQLEEVYDKWISKFGVKYYQCNETPDEEIADTDLLDELTAASWTASRNGVVVNNSLHEPVPRPSAGNVFPERTPARTVLPLLTGQDRFGLTLCVSAVLAQDFTNGSRRIHFTHEASDHPLSPTHASFPAVMEKLLTLLENKVFVKEVQAGYACYRQGETVQVSSELVSFESIPVAVTAEMEIRDLLGNVVDHQRKNIEIAANATAEQVWQWRPASFDDDEYTVNLLIRRGGQAVSKARNGFVVWNQAVAENGPRIGLRGCFFTVNDKPTFITGTNYYESTRGEVMWFKPDVSNIIRDHQQMQACGVNMIRPHYHHLKWFRDYFLYHHQSLPPYYQELDSLTDAMPDERAWRIWDLFIYLGQKYGIVYNGDLFTLVPEEMGDPRGWFGTVEAVYDPSRREAQKAFLLALDRRYRDIPGISWDMFNEPCGASHESVGQWAGDLRQALVEDGSPRLVTVGGPVGLAGVDYDAPHGRMCEDWNMTMTRPLLLQEVHNDYPDHLEAEVEQAHVLRDIIVTALGGGACGWMPWSWTRQMRLWQDNFEHHHSAALEKWDDRLGLHTHDDGTPKPAGVLFKDIAVLLADVEPQSIDTANKAIATSAGQLLARLPAETNAGHVILHRCDTDVFAAMARDRIAVRDTSLVTGPQNSYLFMRALGGSFHSAKRVLVKSEIPGPLRIHRGGAKSVALVDARPHETHALESLAFTADAQDCRLHVDAEMTRYWIELRFG